MTKSKEKKTKIPQPTVTSPATEVTLVSSEGKKLKVDRRYLEFHSPIFRDMLEIGGAMSIETSQEIILSDSVIEATEVVEAAINLMRHSSLPPSDLEDIRQYGIWSSLINFFRKYECKGLETYIAHYLYQLIEQTPSFGAEIFLLGAQLGDPLLCRLSIRRGASYQWQPYDGEIELSYRRESGKNVFDVTSWSLNDFTSTPPKYLWALTAAMSKSPLMKAPNQEKGWNAVSEHFFELLMENC